MATSPNSLMIIPAFEVGALEQPVRGLSAAIQAATLPPRPAAPYDPGNRRSEGCAAVRGVVLQKIRLGQEIRSAKPPACAGQASRCLTAHGIERGDSTRVVRPAIR